MAIVFDWNGDALPDEVRRRLPKELQGLSSGRYVLEPVNDAPELTTEEESGLQAAIDSLREAGASRFDEAKARIDRIPETGAGRSSIFVAAAGDCERLLDRRDLQE